jgi:hypothetical protein
MTTTSGMKFPWRKSLEQGRSQPALPTPSTRTDNPALHPLHLRSTLSTIASNISILRLQPLPTFQVPTEEDRFRNIISHDSNSWMLYSSTNKCQMTIIRMRLFEIRSSALLDAAQGEATIVYMMRYTVYQILKIEHSLTLRLIPCR